MGQKDYEECQDLNNPGWREVHKDNEIIHAINNNLSRLADAIEEILRLVKKDMEPRIKEKD